MENEGKVFPKYSMSKNRLFYYKSLLYISDNEGLQTTIAKGCDDSQVARHFRQEKTIEIVIRTLYWKGLTVWVNNYVRSYEECQHHKSPRHA